MVLHKIESCNKCVRNTAIKTKISSELSVFFFSLLRGRNWNKLETRERTKAGWKLVSAEV